MTPFYTRRGQHLVTHGVCSLHSKPFVPEGCVVVHAAPPTEATATPPEPGAMWNLDAGQWDLPLVTAEQAWAAVRYRRDEMLTASDWVRLRADDLGEPVPPEWLAYRQALRDITEQEDPLNIVWPEAPSG